MVNIPGRWFFGVASDGRLRLWCATTALDATVAIANDGAWHHAAVVVDRALSEVRIYLDGVRVGTSAIPTFHLYGEILVGTYNPESNAEALKGYLQDVRLTMGMARYTANFTPPAAPFQNSDVGGDLSPQRKVLAIPSPVPPIVSGGQSSPAGPVLQPQALRLDLQDGGMYRIVGDTKKRGTLAPLRRRVQLYNQRDNRLIRETWSDAATGDYAFNNVRGGDGTTYFVAGFDHTNTDKAVITDQLVPEPMP